MSQDDTTSRVLALLSLLQSRRQGSGTELAARLGVSVRTLRRDVERLRELGYGIAAERGRDGGYRLEAGSGMPPLLLDGDETVALAVALGTVATSAPGEGLAEAAASALIKLEPVIPQRYRERLRALRQATHAPALPGDVAVDPELFAQLALAVRDRARIRIAYADAWRSCDPHAIVAHGRRWYLLAWDHTTADWRTFRLDRISRAENLRVIFEPHEVPGGDAAAWVAERFRETPVHRVTVTIAAPHAEVSAYLGDYVRDLSPHDDHTRWRLEAERLEVLAGALIWLPWPFTIDNSPELTALLGSVAAKWQAFG